MNERSPHRETRCFPQTLVLRFSHWKSTTRLVVAIALLASSLTVVLEVSPSTADSYQMANGNTSDGWYPNQPELTPSAVSSGDFGSLFDATLSGQIYAQPLVDQGQVLVVSENDNAYGVSTSTGTPTWTQSYGPVATPAVDPKNTSTVCGDIGSNVGITGTPVIDSVTNTAYFVAARATGPDRIFGSTDYGASTEYYLEAANVSTGAPPAGWPAGGVLMSGAANNDSGTTFNADYQTQRPGLVLVNGVVYAAFSAQCDFLPPTGAYTGWVIGVSTTTDAVTTLWATETRGNNGGGIWQSGGAPVVDASGNIYVVTGNSFSSSVLPPVGSNGFNAVNNYGEAVVELSTSSGTLTPVDWFTPADATFLDYFDLDFSSGAPVELPASMGTPQEPNVLLGVGKNAILYSMDMSNLGGYQHGSGGGDAVPTELAVSGGVWGRPAVWPGDGGYIYLPATGSSGHESSGTLNAYQRVVSASGAVGFQPAGTAASFGFTSGSPVVTSNGMNSGSSLVWVVHSSGSSGSGGQLDAFDPIPQNSGPNGTLTKVWGSALFTAEKYTSPGVGDGAIYVGTKDGHLLGFGFTTATPPLTGPNVDFAPSIVSQAISGTATFTASTTTTITSISSTGSAYAVGSPSPALGGTGVTLQSGQSLSVPVTFTPNLLGSNPGSITANTTTGSIMSATTLTLSGTGMPSSVNLIASPASVDFGNQPIGGPSVSQVVTMTNHSGATIQILGITAPLTTTPFWVTGGPAVGPLADGASVEFTANFAPPGTSGNYTHVFGSVATVDTNNGNFGVPLSGGAAPPAVLALVPTSLDFNNVQVGQSATLNFSVKDNGGLPLTITSSSPPSGGVGLTATTVLGSNTVISGNSSIHETVKFAPTVSGAVSDSWVITGNDGNPPAVLVIHGTGVVNPPDAPTNATASAASAQATVTWVAPSNDGGAPILSYTATASDSTNAAHGGQTCTTSGASTRCVITGLTNGDLYNFSVTATNSAGTGASSNNSNVVTPGIPGLGPPVGVPSPGGTVVQATLPDAPTNATASAASAQATVTWVAPSNDGGAPILSYTATASDSTNAAHGGQTCTTSGASTRCVITGLTNGDLYNFSVTATNSAGTGASSNNSNAVTPGIPGLLVNAPGAPTVERVLAGDANALVSWRVPASNGGGLIEKYSVTSSDVTDPSRGGQVCTVSGALTTQCEVKGLTNGDHYIFKVVASNSAGAGASSEPSTSVTPRAPMLRITALLSRSTSSLRLTSQGDPRGGTLSYFTVNGTALGCRITGGALVAATGGTCVVVARRAADASEPLVSSPVTLVKVPGALLQGRSTPLTVAFAPHSSSISPTAKKLLTEDANSLAKGSVVLVTGYADRNSDLAKSRATSVAKYFSRRSKVRVDFVVVTSAAANIVTVRLLAG